MDFPEWFPDQNVVETGVTCETLGTLQYAHGAHGAPYDDGYGGGGGGGVNGYTSGYDPRHAAAHHPHHPGMHQRHAPHPGMMTQRGGYALGPGPYGGYYPAHPR